MLKTRVITALILAPVAIACIFFLPPLGFAIFTGVIISMGAWEWANMAGVSQGGFRIAFAVLTAVLLFFLLQTTAITLLVLAVLWWALALFLVSSYPATTGRWQATPIRLLMGLLVLVPAWVGLNHLRSGSFHLAAIDNNLLLLLYVFCVVWVADIGAYFAGRAFGKAKLAPRVSPGKSWAGVWGGLVAVAVLAVLVSLAIGANAADTALLLLVSLITGAVSVLGDLLESMLKRFRGIKDSSQLLPGHGGIMDRIDSLTAAIPVFTLCITLLGWLHVSPLA
ncbi:phosphatidate cytidylyltransferase [Marinobacter bohaiensis]|uniref:phosphatidate cytidylyltransferase n=1 Tax=Marinobacter bohaiensis TaxID=2201898 RepID=UPI000DAE7FD1|nr:phosphatidate cytidylyltransferase [Marinobacter bohaiensis]